MRERNVQRKQEFRARRDVAVKTPLPGRRQRRQLQLASEILGRIAIET